MWATSPTWQSSASICEMLLELCLSCGAENSAWVSSECMSCIAVAELVCGFPFISFFFNTLIHHLNVDAVLKPKRIHV